MGSKKWTKKYLVVIWLITLIVVIGAIWGHMFKLGSFFGLTDGWGRGSLDTTTENYNFANENISDILIDMNAADIDIQYGSEFSVDATFPEKYAPTVDVKSGKLSIVQKQDVKNFSGNDDFKLDIVIPKDADLKSIRLDIAAGDIDINDIKLEKLELDANAGDIDINNIISEKINIDANAGDINVMGCTADKIELNVNAGDVDVTGNYGKIDCNCDLGDVDIKAPNTDRNDIDVDCALGSVNIVGK